MAQRLSHAIGAESGTLDWHRFPDRESLITLQGDCDGRDVVIVCTMTDPDAKTLPLYFAARTARELGARRVGLVAPYLAYMRQDQRFSIGQAVSAQAYAQLLSTSFDWLITVDPHLHRIPSLGHVFSIPATAVSAMPAVSEWIRNHIAAPVIIGPDSESAQWVECVARDLHAPYVVLEKTRHGDRDVEVSPIDPTAVHGHNPVIIDDIASSGRTLVQTLLRLRALGSSEPACVIVHAVLAEDAEGALRSAGASRIASTNTVPHATNEIDVAPLIAKALAHRLAAT